MTHEIITCPQWGARPPAREPTRTQHPAQRVIFHHTAGHHPELDGHAGETRTESIAYAQAIQAFHMKGNGWIDSGHNFLVCRNGLILQGRWRTVRAIRAKGMVVSAHCPGQNDQVGIEHEHFGDESLTSAQYEASAWLQAWVAHQYGRSAPLPAHPHSEFFATSCPANLKSQIAGVVHRAAVILSGWDKA